VNDGKVLLVQEGKEAVRGVWNLPAGKLEPGETPREAAIRETREEAGISVTPDALVGIYLDDSDVSDDRVINFVFLAQEYRSTPEAAEEDIQQVSWFAPEKAMEKELRAAYIKQAIHDWQDGARIDMERINDLPR
ncbi:MAG: NUDIX domain-containing protein, partial [Candidatus Nanohaloarchaea archaeon]|nr:NUDIX domain-containing protein [Candidatus Nanohaloarchaea archaeon]